jgi:hypothetical protein
LPQAGVGERRVERPVAEEQAEIDVVEITLFTPFVIIAPALDHQVALSRPGAVDQQVDPRSDGRCVFIRQRRLLSHDGSQVAVEGESVSHQTERRERYGIDVAMGPPVTKCCFRSRPSGEHFL